MRVLIIAEHASMKFGGEAALPLHYFRVLRKRGIEAWLIVHERTREELSTLFPKDLDRIHFVADTAAHRFVWQCSKLLPARLSYFTFGLILRSLTQRVQRTIARQLIRTHAIDIVHQPIPVSPKEPSMLCDLGVPVVIGPMNGGMNYPPAFRQMQSRLVDVTLSWGRLFSNGLNRLMPGKLKAATLLVANARTKDALPSGVRGDVIELVENGVDLSVWQGERSSVTLPIASDPRATSDETAPTKLVFVGRLVDWKAVDLLLHAVHRVVQRVPVELEIIGDGSERAALESLAQELGLTNADQPIVRFVGWLSQPECAQRLQAANALVLPSLLECGGAVVLEAMAMGIPVIATRWGGPADYLNDQCGILVEPISRDGFIKGLTEAIAQLAHDPARARAMGQAGYERVLAEFDWDVKVDMMLGIYQRTLERSAKPVVQSEQTLTVLP